MTDPGTAIADLTTPSVGTGLYVAVGYPHPTGHATDSDDRSVPSLREKRH
ncbi:hypothetical protein HSR121_1050 [Halapricum desulfuricans]|uniref:Uncharacterized protein n=1 Tax=Halapricum desulfuricans TaxID=2841257 RepID=A0A897MY63_9EURY|nr:hypothetical protein HSR121_1050 [Halapricum desulfuricans]